MGCELAYLYYHVHSLLHGLDADKLVRAVEVDTSGEDVGTWESAEAELCAVGATTYRLHLWSHPTFLHSLEDDVDDMHRRFDFLPHVVVLVVEFHRYGALAVFSVHVGNTLCDAALACLEAGTVVVANDIAELSRLGVGMHADEMVEALVAFGGLRRLVGGEHGSELHGKAVGIDHLTFSISWMNADTTYVNLCGGGIEVLVFEFADIAAIHGISPLAAKALDIEMVCSHADFLVGIEGDAYVAMLNVVVVAEVAHCLDNLGDARFVVGTEKGVSVGDDKVLADMV